MSKTVNCKSSFEKDLKEAEAEISNKMTTEVVLVKSVSPRTSVFDRLGATACREKFAGAQTDNQKTRLLPLKRTIHNIELTSVQDDMRESKMQRLGNVIVTIESPNKSSKLLTSRLGPKRNVEFVEDRNPLENEPKSMDNKENNVDLMENSIQLTRCKFWPTCKSKDKCQFVHPSEPCKAFPGCKFGATCFFIHPKCRFDANCLNVKCPFTHQSPRTGDGVSEIASDDDSLSHSVVNGPTRVVPQLPRCIFYPKCTNVNCKFFHPNLPCKFGLFCNQKESCLFYHPTTPTSSELKWVASSQPDSSTKTDNS